MSMYYLCTIKFDRNPRSWVQEVPKALNPYLWVKSRLTGGWGPGDWLSLSLPQWPLWLETDSLTSEIMDSGKKCVDGIHRAALCGGHALYSFACLCRRGIHLTVKAGGTVKEYPKTEFRVCLDSGRVTWESGLQRVRLKPTCKNKLVHRTDWEPVHVRLNR